jgi:hypothetical protein
MDCEPEPMMISLNRRVPNSLASRRLRETQDSTPQHAANMSANFRLAALVLLFGMASSAHAVGPWRANEGNTRGWQLMTPKERIEHQAKIRNFTRYEDCHAYQIAHHRLMQERAERMGLSLPGDRHDFCTHLSSPQQPPE